MNELETLQAMTLDELRDAYRDAAGGEDPPEAMTRDELITAIAEEPPR